MQPTDQLNLPFGKAIGPPPASCSSDCHCLKLSGPHRSQQHHEYGPYLHQIQHEKLVSPSSIRTVGVASTNSDKSGASEKEGGDVAPKKLFRALDMPKY